MTSRAFISRSRTRWLNSQICVFCRIQGSFHNDAGRQVFSGTKRPSNRNQNPPNTTQWIRTYAGRHIRVEETPAHMRAKVDARTRLGYFTMLHQMKLLPIDIEAANQIVGVFLEPTSQIPKDVVKELASKFNLQLGELTILALATFRIPDVSDKTGRLPPSRHGDAAKRLLMACSQAGEPTATFNILRAILSSSSLSKAKEVAQNFSQADVRACRKELERLADNGDSAAMTLLGQFLEQEGSVGRARALYEKAVESTDAANLDVGSENRISEIAVPQTPPWVLLGELLLREDDQQLREQAEEVLQKGALEGDDPLAYYHLASFRQPKSHDWLLYMTKAASAGHAEAAYQIANFYMDLDNSMNLHSTTPEWLKEGKFANSLRWLTQLSKSAPGNLAQEWFGLAADKGHKPSMLELADIEELSGDVGNAKRLLEQIVSPSGKTEEWPQTVAEARLRLRKLASQNR